MKVSIITVCFNSEKTLEETIQSVLIQDYPEVEHIIIDGGSTDGTLAIIRKYAAQITQWISEKDHGMYDAMNKGIALATGDVIGILNSDDVYLNSHAISDLMAAMQTQGVDAVYADLRRHSDD